MKRLLLALIALFAFGGPTLAQSLAPGEITLTIEALGVAKPDSAYVTQTLRGRGEDEAKAKADLAAKRAAVSASLARIGVPSSAIKFGEITVQQDYSYPVAMEAAPAPSNEVDAAQAAGDDAAQAARDAAAPVDMPMAMPIRAEPPQAAVQIITVTVADLKTLEAIKAALPVEEDYRGSPDTFYTTRDREGAHRVAVADALAKARAEADLYAAGLGMRVVRIARVSSEKQGLSWPDLMQWFAKIDGRGNPDADYFLRLAGSNFAGAKVDFVIGPK